MHLKPFSTCSCQVVSLFFFCFHFIFLLKRKKDDFGGNLKLGYDKMDKLEAKYDI